MLEPVTTASSTWKSIDESAVRQPIEYRLPAAHAKKAGPKRLHRVRDELVPLEDHRVTGQEIVPLKERAVAKRKERGKPLSRTPTPALTSDTFHSHRDGKVQRSPFSRESKKTTAVRALSPTEEDRGRGILWRLSPGAPRAHSMSDSPDMSPGPVPFKSRGPPILKRDGTTRGDIRVIVPDLPPMIKDAPSEESRSIVSLPPITTESKAVTKMVSDRTETTGYTRHWKHRYDYFLTALGVSVGLSTVCRFPCLVHSNGGGTFLVAYAVMMLMLGLPLYYMELVISQFSGRGFVGLLGCAPLTRGVGYTMIIYSWSTGVCWSIYIVYFVLYIFYAYHDNIPWATCKDDWGKNCFSPSEESMICKNLKSGVTNSYWYLKNVHSSFPFHYKHKGTNAPANSSSGHCLNATRRSAEAYLVEEMWHLSSGIEDMGPTNLNLLGVLFLSWGIIVLPNWSLLSLKRCIQVMTVVMVVLLLLLIACVLVLVPGSISGVSSLFGVEERFMDLRLWGEAASHAIASLGSCSGLTFCIGSHCEYGENMEMSVLAVCCVQFVLGLASTIVLYAMLGNIVIRRGGTIQEIKSSVHEIGIVATTDVAAATSTPHVLVTFYFIVLITAGLCTQTFLMRMCVEQVTCIASGETLSGHQFTTLVVLCILGFALSVPLATSGGPYITFLIVNVVNNSILSAVATLEVVGFAYFYGVARLTFDVRYMLQKSVSYYWRATWHLSVPFITMCLMFGRLADLLSMNYKDISNNPYPVWVLRFVGAFICVGLLPVPVFAARHFFKQGWNIAQSLQTNEEWGPAVPTKVIEYKTKAPQAAMCQ